MVWTVLAWLFRMFHCTIKRCLFPLPTTIDVYPGVEGSLQNRLVTSLLRYCDGLTAIETVTEESAASAPAVWIDRSFRAIGFASTCNYLGRITNLLPSTPENALIVDAAMEDLYGCISKYIERNGSATNSPALQLCSALERRIVTDGTWLEEMDNVTLADVCWFETLQWLMEKEDNVSLEGHPKVLAWYSLMTQETAGEKEKAE